MLNQIQKPEEIVGLPQTVTLQQEVADEQGSRAPEPLSAEELKDLKTRLESPYVRIRSRAESEFRELGVAGILPLMAAERKKRKRIRTVCVTIYVAVCTLLLLLHFITHSLNLIPFLNMLSLFFGAFAASSGFHRKGVSALATLEQVEAVSELISALDISDKETQQVVRPALTKLLPQLKSSDAVLLSQDNRRTLRLYLQGKLSGSRVKFRDAKINKQLTLAVLKALQQIGDETFIGVVEGLGEVKRLKMFPVDAEIGAAARECLPYLRERASELAANNQLLRPSQANSVGGADTLVRPVTAKPELHEEELVRAIE